MTVLEQEFMNRLPNSLRHISDSIDKLTDAVNRQNELLERLASRLEDR